MAKLKSRFSHIKYLRRLKDGRLISSFINYKGQEFPTAQPLEYHPGRIITAPKGTAGIFIADSYTPGNVNSVEDFSHVEIYECKPLAEVKLTTYANLRHSPDDPVASFSNREVCKKVYIGKLIAKLGSIYSTVDIECNVKG